MARRPDFPEYDLHPCGARVDDALAQLNRIVSSARGMDVVIVVLAFRKRNLLGQEEYIHSGLNTILVLPQL